MMPCLAVNDDDRMVTAQANFDVAIVGYGPTGATLANLVAQIGLSVVVIEREPEMYHLPRAVHFDGETMRVFQTIGIADDLIEKVHVNPGMRFVAPDNALLLDWPRPQEMGPQGWHASYRLHQPDLEKLLRDKAALHEKVTVRSNCDVTALKDDGDQVHLKYLNHQSRTQSDIRAKFVIGCDGARSFVRKSIGAELQNLGFEERWLVVDLLLKRDRPDLGDHSVQFCDPARPMTYCRSPGIRRRWEITVLDHETDAEMTVPANIWQLLSRWIRPDDADLERSAVYTFRSAIADKWRKGRILIAGDAAHLTPPFMGQGMCTGIRDASNLGWKLALCADGHSLELLDTYQAERSPHAEAFITTAMKLGGLINALDCDQALAMATDDKSGATKLKTIAPRLGCSALVDASVPHSGQICGQPRLLDGTRLDDIIGYRRVAISRVDVSLNQKSLHLLDARAEPELLALLDNFETNILLVRPDRYIGCTAKSAAELYRFLSHHPNF